MGVLLPITYDVRQQSFSTCSLKLRMTCFFSRTRRDKKEMLLFILVLCCQLINKDARTRISMMHGILYQRE